MKDRRSEITGILLILVSLLVLLSLVSFDPAEEPTISENVAINNAMGILGVYISHWLIKLTIGYASYIFPLLGLLWGWWIFSKKPLKEIAKLTVYVIGLAFLTSIAIGLPPVIKGITEITSYHYSGLLGGLLAKLLHDFLGPYGSSLLVLGIALVLIRGYFSWSFYWPFQKIGERISTFREKRGVAISEKRKEEERKEHTQRLLAQLKERKVKESPEQLTIIPEGEPKQPSPKFETIIGVTESKPELEVEIPKGDRDLKVMDEELVLSQEGEYTIGEEVIEKEIDLDSQMKERRQKYRLPSVDLLNSPEEIGVSTSHEELVEKANFLVQSLLTFGVEGKVVNISPGPIITLFEVEPAEGVRVNKFVQLSDDLARVMKASRVRVIAPIPGKATVGIEIPNQNPSIVYMKSVISSEKFAQSESKLAVALGKTTNGENFILELDKMPHLLIAGTTGSGKSVCINTIITSILYRATPEDVRFILIDPKKLELASYKLLEGYHLITSEDISEYVITTSENAILALRAAELEMSRRYDVLAESVVRNIEEYNHKATKDMSLETMPYLVLIIDELADLMLQAPKEVEAPITRLAQMARAVGIHLVLATQRPSVDVITGVIKANFPARIAFQVATRVDSRTIIDSNGAEKLLGKGDMLYLPPGSSQPIRLHNSFVSLEEIKRIVNHINHQPKPVELKLEGSRVQISEEGTFSEELGGKDELFEEAVRLIITHQQGSISLLQRRLRIGYSRAARLIDQMEQAGIVGPFTGSKAREVLVDESFLSGLSDNDI